MSLLSLTTHFAQVQFRLRQIVNAPNDEKEVGRNSIRTRLLLPISASNATYCLVLAKMPLSGFVCFLLCFKKLNTFTCKHQNSALLFLKVLLRELEEFAFKGIPDVTCCSGLKNMQSLDEQVSAYRERDSTQIIILNYLDIDFNSRAV